ncbi:MAG: protein-L-isoaspartate(D-aspartate) O-methyltransferase [bacterium]|nr:protein-L-isoaspartate(D-aspartate) O-methyltransferase [bacterium]
MDHRRASRRMVEEYVIPRGIKDELVINAMIETPRHLFVEDAFQGQAYGDSALPIGEGQSISRPYTVARMTEALELKGGERVLEIGGGSAYQSAVLAVIAGEVFTVERLKSLSVKARKLLLTLRCHNVLYRVGDGTLGWPDKAPFDAILVAASSPGVSPDLMDQLKVGGRLVLPIAKGERQILTKYVKTGDSFTRVELEECSFVPLIGEYGWKEKTDRA